MAATVIAERGESASMSEIAKAAGVGRATLYRYFPSRESLFQALVESAFADLTARIADAKLDTVPVVEALARFTRAVIAAVGKYRALAVFEKSPEQAAAVESGLVAPLESLFERAASEGIFRTDLPVSALIPAYVGLLEGTSTRVVQGQLGLEEASAAITTIFLHGVLDASRRG